MLGIVWGVGVIRIGSKILFSFLVYVRGKLFFIYEKTFWCRGSVVCFVKGILGRELFG